MPFMIELLKPHNMGRQLNIVIIKTLSIKLYYSNENNYIQLKMNMFEIYIVVYLYVPNVYTSDNIHITALF